MKKLSVLLGLSGMLFFNCAFAQRKAFHFGLVYPISTNGTNAADYTNGASLHLLGGISKNEETFILSGVTSIIKNNAAGAQIAGLSNHIGNSGKGIAIAGLANTVKNNYSGIQIAGLLNMTGDVKGFQLAGIVNSAKKVKGVQLSGLINIAEESAFPLGFINIIKKGERAIGVSYDYNKFYTLSVKTGGTYSYGILAAAYRPDNTKWLGYFGWGIKASITENIRLRNEISIGTSLNDIKNSNVFITRYSLLPAFKVAKHIELFGGAVFDYLNIKSADNFYLLSAKSLWKKYDTQHRKQIQLGYTGGIHLLF